MYLLGVARTCWSCATACCCSAGSLAICSTLNLLYTKADGTSLMRSVLKSQQHQLLASCDCVSLRTDTDVCLCRLQTRVLPVSQVAHHSRTYQMLVTIAADTTSRYFGTRQATGLPPQPPAAAPSSPPGHALLLKLILLLLDLCIQLLNDLWRLLPLAC
eukprot:GHRQ01034526.1.p1 GENE.GHRQ01034526.1~~GHRQ01034526.1.p1  ORF type:complete len:159 (+),score=12.28 GHRQ01034526.1:306-782(+)